MNTASVTEPETLTDDEIAALYATASDVTMKTLTREMTRRDRRAAQSAADKAWGRVKAEWYDAAYAQYLQADAECRGTCSAKTD